MQCFVLIPTTFTKLCNYMYSVILINFHQILKNDNILERIFWHALRPYRVFFDRYSSNCFLKFSITLIWIIGKFSFIYLIEYLRMWERKNWWRCWRYTTPTFLQSNNGNIYKVICKGLGLYCMFLTSKSFFQCIL